MSNALVDSILKDTKDTRVRLAMLLGAALEGGYGPTFGVGDQSTGGSYGPYQIHLVAHPGVTAAEASDPAWATNYMLGNYTGAVKKVPSSLWSSNPEAAAEQAARIAEAPAEDYVVARGQGTVDDAYKKAMSALSGGVGATGKSPLGIAGGAVGGAAKSAAGGVAGAVTSAIGSVLDPLYEDAKDFGIKLGFAGLGLALVLGGLVKMTSGARQKVSKSADPLAAGQLGSRGGGAAGESALPEAATVAAV